MIYKHVMFRSAAREKVLRGAAQLADAIRVTLGPKSKSVLIQKKWGPPLVCNDGVTIAKEFVLKDAEENLGAQMLRQAAERTGDLVGDGTSGSTVLARAMFADGVRNVVAGASAIDLKRGLDRAAKAAIAALKEMSRPVSTRLEKVQVAAISGAPGKLARSSRWKSGTGKGVASSLVASVGAPSKLAWSSRRKSGSGQAVAGRPITSVAGALVTALAKRTQ